MLIAPLITPKYVIAAVLMEETGLGAAVRLSDPAPVTEPTVNTTVCKLAVTPTARASVPIEMVSPLAMNVPELIFKFPLPEMSTLEVRVCIAPKDTVTVPSMTTRGLPA